MSIEALISEGIQGYHPSIARAVDSVNAAIMLEHIAFWQRKTEDGEGWAYRSQEDIEERTALSVKKQQRARSRLKELGVLKEKRKGVPAKLFYRLDYDKLQVLLQSGPKVQSRVAQTSTQEWPKGTDYLSKEVSKELSIKGVYPHDIEESLRLLENLDGYPKSVHDNALHLYKMSDRHPGMNLPKEVRKFCNYYEDQGFSATQRPRARLTRWLDNASEWSKNGRTNVSEPKRRRKEKVN